MRTQLIRLGGGAIALLFIAATAQAQGKSHEHAHKEAKGDSHQPAAVVVAPDQGRRDAVPPGLAKKPGQMPPGQYKKHYTTAQGADVLSGIFRDHGYTVTRVVPSGTSRYVYYRLHDGTEHRAIIRPGTDRLSISNVPTTLLQQLMSRLY